MDETTKTYFEKSGAIIVRGHKGVQEVLLEYRGREYLKDWSFPKGGVEIGETAEEAAKREIKEETGLEVELIRPLPTIYYHNKHDGDVRVAMFLARPLSSHLEAEFDDDRLKWVPSDEVCEKLSYDNLKEYFESVRDSLNITTLK